MEKIPATGLFSFIVQKFVKLNLGRFCFFGTEIDQFRFVFQQTLVLKLDKDLMKKCNVGTSTKHLHTISY